VANKAKDHLRRTTAAPVFADSDRLASAAAVDPGPSEKAAQTECRNDVMRAILCLPLEQREVVTLHLHGELTFSTIAGLLGASTNTVQSRYRYALQKLRTLLGAGVQP
jgi:RNA polymerase sigma-70 factor (ECF subfamily)